MQEGEARSPFLGVAQIERFDGLHRGRQQFLVFGLVRPAGIPPVAEQGKTGVLLAVGQVSALQPLRQRLDRAQAGEHAGRHHEGAVLLLQTVFQRQAWQAVHAERLRQHPVHQCDQAFERHQKRQQQRRPLQKPRQPGVKQQHQQQERAHQRKRRIQGPAQTSQPTNPDRGSTRRDRPPQRLDQFGAATSDQPVGRPTG